MAKTSLHLKCGANIWPAVQKWAAVNNYLLETPGESTRLYIRKSDNTSEKISVAISQIGSVINIDAWFSDSVRNELEIDSPSLYAALPRKEALSEIQKLKMDLIYTPSDEAKMTGKRNIAFRLGRSIRKLTEKK